MKPRAPKSSRQTRSRAASCAALRAIIAAGGDPVALADRHVKVTQGGSATEMTVKELVDGKPLAVKAGDTVMVMPSNAPKLTADPAASTPAARSASRRCP